MEHHAAHELDVEMPLAERAFGRLAHGGERVDQYFVEALAVADAFSAMTTTRPYRKALAVEEALKRLGDAAGRQLEEDLVVAFIAGMESAPDAPMPDQRRAGIWRPTEWVARG